MNDIVVKKNSQYLRSQIIKLLNDGEFHSGESLAKLFSLSRSAISNHIKALSELGIDIYKVKGKGYRLASTIELLDLAVINESLSVQEQALIEVFNITNSTNDYIKQRLNELPSGHVCFAESQTQGRGRHGRKWVSPYGASLYCSMAWHFSSGYQALNGLSLVIGVVLNNTLKELGIQGCKLKWPNDLYYNDKKLAGILIEVEGQVGGSTSAVIGIGLNLSLPDNIEGIDQAFTDLREAHPDGAILKNKIAGNLVKNLWRALRCFETEGLEPFIRDWEVSDQFYNKPVRLIMGSEEKLGICRGIAKSGAILIDDGEHVEAFYGGEISVRHG